MWVFLLSYCCLLPNIAALEIDLTIKTIQALRRALTFYEKNADLVNLDSIFGMRAAEGTLHNLIQVSDSINHPFKKDIIHLHKSFQEICNQAYQNFQRMEESYVESFKFLIQKQWFYQAKQREFDSSLIDNHLGGKISGEESDTCMTSIIGTQQTGERKKCQVPPKCWRLMSSSGATSYRLTHQALFFMLADLNGCTDVLTKKYEYDKEQMFTQLVSNIYIQMMKSFHQSKTDTSSRDLFLEQGVVCIWLGLHNRCMKKHYIEEVLRWQHHSGCVNENSLYPEKGAVNFEKVVDNMRHLKVEEVLADGCLSHTTGLYVAYLATSLNWLIQQTYKPKDISSEIKYFFFITGCLLVVLIVIVKCRRKFRAFKYMHLI